MATAIRCTLPNCSCECFAPGKNQLRTCEQCRHGWVAHALDKLSTGQACPSLLAEVVHSDIVFDITSLVLYGAQAAPVRLRILLDRLFSVLKAEEVDQILQGLGWGHEDYARGYVLQDQDGKVLEHWTVVSKDEEPVILNQFLRFGETKSIAEVMIQELNSSDAQSAQKRSESDIRAFIQRMSGRHKLNNSFEGTEPKRLAPSPEVVRTVQKGSQRASTHDGDRPRTKSFPPREPAQGSDLPAHNIHLANLEQTVLKAGVVPSQAQARARGGYPSTPQPAKRPPTTQMNSTRDAPAASVNSVPTVLNSSVSMLPGSVKRYPPFSFKGHRKLTLSKRRAWTPYMTVPNSKQVKCNTCNKWFYDKGTWKIHFGAVHLKVKYRCTVEGCNMAFSSLRSRNRHSANPSPRIHRFVYSSRRGNKRRNLAQGEGMQLPPDCEDGVEKLLDVSQDIAMVTDDVTIIKEEEGDKSMEEEVTILDNETENGGGPCSETSPHNSVQDEISPGEIALGGDSPATDTTQMMKEETAEEHVEISNGIDAPCHTVDHKLSENTDYSQPANGSPTTHHFKKRKSNAPRKFFIPKEEDDADCQVESVTYKTEDTSKQTDDILDADEEETGIDLEEVPEYEANAQDDGCLSNDYHYIPTQIYGQKSQQLPELTPTSQSQGLDMQLDQNNLRTHVAEQLGIGIDTCYYINAEGLPSCYLCGKNFQSRQTVKVHYQNVHLKLMHACTINGCNAMFPSRRSRDRHSTNFNLHRKLFEKGVPLKDGFEQMQPSNASYGTQSGQGSDQAPSSNHTLSDSNSTSSTEGIRKSLKQATVDASPSVDSLLDNGAHHLTANEIDLRLTKPELHSSSKHRFPAQDSNPPSSSSSYGSSPPQRYVMQVDQNGLSPLSYSQAYSTPTTSAIPPPKDLYPLKFMGSLICNICKKTYSTKDTLRTHYRNIHLREMHKCTVQGCNLMFSSVRSRNRHSQNPNLHRHCLPGESNPDGLDQIDVTQP